MKKWIAALAVATLASGVYAANLDKGTYEARFNGSYDGDTALDHQLDTTLGLGYFIADNLEVAGIVGASDNDVVTLWYLGGLAEYNFDLGGPLVPYVGGAIQWIFSDVTPEGSGNDSNNDAGDVSGHAGVKYFVTEDLAVNLQGEYHKASDDVYVNSDREVEDDNWLITWGLRYYFDL